MKAKLFTLLAVLLFGFGQVWAEDFTITPIYGSYLSPGNLVKITYSGDLKTSSTQIQTTDKNKSGVITLTTIAPGVYLKSASFTDANWSSATKRATLECTSGGSIVGVDGVYTFTASANATTATISITAGTGGAAKLGSVSLVVTNGTTNDIETYSTFAKTDDNFSFTAKCNGTSITPAAALSSSTWTVSSNNISAPSSNDSKTITISSANNIKFIAFYDSNCRLSIVEKSSSGGTCDGASWSVGSSPTKSVTFKNGIGTSLTITKVFVITEAATKHTVTIDPNGGSYASTPDGWTLSAGVYTKSIASGTSFSAPDGLTKGTDDLTWKDGSDNPITFPVSITGDITFVAQWAPHTASSDATLSALSVAGCTLNETFDPATTAYTITLPFYGAMPVVGDVTATKNDPNAEDPEVSISGNVITIHCEAEDGTTTKDYTITVTISPAPTASSSINIEQLVLDNGKTYDIVSALTAANIVTDGRNGLDSLNDDPGKTNRNYGFLGLKFKKKDADIIKIVVPADNVLNVKFGNVGVALTTTINGAAGSNVAKKTDGTSSTFHLDAAAYVREVVFRSSDAQTVTLQQVKIGADVDPITLPWLVTYDAGAHGTCATASEVWTGSALTLPTVTPESGWNFEGWNDDEDNPASSPYTPSKNVTLTAQYTAQASPFDLTALTYKIGTGAATNVGYVDGTFTYNIVLPYAPSYDAITVAPTLKEASSSLKGDEVLTVTSLPGAATFTVVEDGGANEQLYTVNFTKAPKDGICLIKGNVGNDTFVIDEEASLLSGTADKNNVRAESSTYDTKTGWKFNARPARLGITLSGAETFQAGDIVEVFVTTVANISGANDKMRIFDANEGTSAHLLVASEDDLVQGANRLVLPTTSTNSLYLHRTKDGDYDNFNPYVAYVAVYRAMNPVLTAITFDGVDADQDSEFAFSVTLPQGTNLGTMTVTPTIVWNGAGSAAPIAAWAWGANTYRVTDKDGDYTDYTITLTEDELKHNVSFNTHGGSTIDPVQVVDGGYLAPAQVPEDPTKDENVFKFWSETEDGAEVDITTVQINADKTFHAVWEAEPAGIKLINGDVVNHTNFLTGTNETTVEIESVEHKCVDFTTAGSNRTTVASIANLTEFIQYNATTNKAKIKLTLYNTRSSAVSAYLHMLEEGSETPTTEEISIPAGEVLKTDFYEFNSEKNRSFYITCGNRDYIKVLQVKVIDDGTTTLKKAGQVGYSVNTLKSRIFAPQQSAISFEGLTINANAVCKPLSTTALKIKNAYNISFHADAAMTLAVTTEGNQTYYVSTTADGTTNETSFNGRSEFEITSGDWYIHAGNSELKVAKLEFTAPKCAVPVIDAQPATKLDFAAGDMTASVTAHATDGGTLKYQWYKAADDSEVSGATESTLTTTEEGTYYVIVTNTLTDHSDNFVKSDEATLKYRKANDATLSSLTVSTGTLDPAFDAEVLEYNVTLLEGTTTVPTLTATAAMAAYGATADVTNAAAFVNYEATSTVLVTAEDGITKQTYTVHFYVDHAIATLVDVTDDITWDFSKANNGSAATSGLCNEEIFANVAGIVNNGDFESDNLIVTANKFASGKLQASMIKFHTTVDGLIKVIFSDTGSSGERDYRYLVVNGNQTDKGSKNTTAVTYYGFVPAGDVVLTVVGGGTMLNFTSIKFMKKAAPDHARDAAHGDSWMAPGELGTICLENGAIATGGDILELVGKNAEGKVVFATVNHMEPGKPYLFESKSNAMNFYYTDETPAENPVNTGAMKGSFIDYTLNDVENVYYFSGHALWRVSGDHLNVVAHRAYVKLDEVDDLSSAAPAPGRRYITMNVHGQNQTTGIEDLMSGDAPKKVLIEGTLFILRGEKVFDATGRLVK